MGLKPALPFKNVSWWYNWGAAPFAEETAVAAYAAREGIEFVPMQWSKCVPAPLAPLPLLLALPLPPPLLLPLLDAAAAAGRCCRVPPGWLCAPPCSARPLGSCMPCHAVSAPPSPLCPANASAHMPATTTCSTSLSRQCQCARRWGVEDLDKYMAARPRGSRVLLGFNEVRCAALGRAAPRWAALCSATSADPSALALQGWPVALVCAAAGGGGFVAAAGV